MQSRALGAASLYTASGQRKYLNGPERKRFIATAHECTRAALRTLCLTLAYTGCRISEALALTAMSIDRESGLIAIRSLKKRGVIVVREVPVPSFLLDAIATVHGLPHLPSGNRLWPLSRGRAWQLVKMVMAQAGIAGGVHATPKGLRHGFGLHAVRSNVPLNLVQKWLGHTRLEITALYLQALGDEERELASRMWRHDPPCASVFVGSPTTKWPDIEMARDPRESFSVALSGCMAFGA